MDQMAALHWVQQNINKFGGDPNAVTLAGHGSGAACINFLMTSPTMVPGLFHRVILLSGSAYSSWVINSPLIILFVFCRKLNLLFLRVGIGRRSSHLCIEISQRSELHNPRRYHKKSWTDCRLSTWCAIRRITWGWHSSAELSHSFRTIGKLLR